MTDTRDTLINISITDLYRQLPKEVRPHAREMIASKTSADLAVLADLCDDHGITMEAEWLRKASPLLAFLEHASNHPQIVLMASEIRFMREKPKVGNPNPLTGWSRPLWVDGLIYTGYLRLRFWRNLAETPFCYRHIGPRRYLKDPELRFIHARRITESLCEKLPN